MKKIGAVALTALLAGSAWSPYVVKANEDVIVMESEEVKDVSDFMRATGVITNIEIRENERMVTVENDEGLITVFRIHDETLLFNSGTSNEMEPGRFEEGYESGSLLR